MTSPLSAAMDVTQLSKTWCETCDPRLLGLTKKTLANDQLLSKQLTFKMNTEAPSEKPHGAFHIDRLYCAGFDQFPDCIRWPPAVSHGHQLFHQLFHQLTDQDLQD